jgi:peptidoglycan hydrolase-like protein with peptidoglycan-binding domain
VNAIQRIQQVLCVVADGDFGPVSQRALQAAMADDSVLESIQGILNVPPDGLWGPVSKAALQKLLERQMLDKQ